MEETTNNNKEENPNTKKKKNLTSEKSNVIKQNIETFSKKRKQKRQSRRKEERKKRREENQQKQQEIIRIKKPIVDSISAINKECTQTYGFVANPAKAIWENIPHALKSINTSSFLQLPYNLHCHNLCEKKNHQLAVIYY
jgi:hypothetical protein